MMSSSSEAAEEIMKISIDGIERTIKIVGVGAKNIIALIYSIMKDNEKTVGKAKLKNMLKQGKPVRVFTVKQSDFKTFSKEAKQYGVMYCELKSNLNDGVIDILVKEEDASKIDRIISRMDLSSYKESAKTNPQEATNEKSPRSKPSSETQKSSDRGTETKPSVKEKLVKAKEESKRQNSQNKSERVQAKKEKVKVRAK